MRSPLSEVRLVMQEGAPELSLAWLRPGKLCFGSSISGHCRDLRGQLRQGRGMHLLGHRAVLGECRLGWALCLSLCAETHTGGTHWRASNMLLSWCFRPTRRSQTMTVPGPVLEPRVTCGLQAAVLPDTDFTAASAAVGIS